MAAPDPGVVAQFLAAGHGLVDLCGRVPADAWSRPALGSWDVRALVGHAGRGIGTLVDYLAAPTDQAPVVDSPGAYFAAATALTADPAFNETIRQRGIEAGRALGDHPEAALAAALSRARAALADLDDDPVIPTALGPMHVSAYLPTRIFELTVHSLDLASALGIPAQPPTAAMRTALGLCMDIALATGQAARVLAALTGRQPLPEGFSTVP